jgi:hypothetical protein
MAKSRAVHKHDLRQLGWKALVTELGIANATRFIMDLSASGEDYTKLRKKVFAQQTLDELYTEIKTLEAQPKSRR